MKKSTLKSFENGRACWGSFDQILTVSKLLHTVSVYAGSHTRNRIKLEGDKKPLEYQVRWPPIKTRAVCLTRSWLACALDPQTNSPPRKLKEGAHRSLLARLKTSACLESYANLL